jgi:hypothetical protein
LNKMKTITFFSYKGGVGRTLLLANFAEYLAYRGKNILIADFDLEAPGIHFKFKMHPDFKKKKGLVDFINNAINDIDSIVSLEKYIHTIQSNQSGNLSKSKSIKIIPAGDAPSRDYADKYSQIPWSDLYHNFKDKNVVRTDKFETRKVSGLRIFLTLQKMIQDLDPKIDYFLIDSRTGITDIGGTALTILPDTIVGLFNNNPENIKGMQLIINSSKNTKLRTPLKKAKVHFVPVLTRIPEDHNFAVDRIVSQINEGLSVKDKLRKEEICTIRSEPELEIIEELRFASTRSLRDSVVLRDYLNAFCAIEPELSKDKNFSELLKLIPSREELEYRNNKGCNEYESIEDQLLQGKKLEVIKPIFVEYNGGKDIENKIKKQFSIFIDAIIKNLTLKLYNKYIYMNAPDDKINWDILGFQISVGRFGFCAEPFYLTNTRSHYLDIVQFGELETFTCFISRDSELYNSDKFGICLFDNSKKTAFKKNFSEFYKKCKKHNLKFEIGVIGDHSAAIEVYRDFDFIPLDNINYQTNKDSIWKWLVSDKTKIEYRMIICDHSVAKYLNRMAFQSKIYKNKFVESSKAVTFKFQEPIPVGFVFPIEDKKWRKRISQAVIDAFLDDEFNFKWSEVIEELKKYHIKCFDSKLILKQLIWDLTFKEAEYYLNKLRKSIK